MMRKGLLVALAVVIADQVHKYVMIYVLGMAKLGADSWPVIESGSKTIAVTSFFNLVMVWNRGVSFGMFNHGAVTQYQPIILTMLALFIVMLLLKWLKKAGNNFQVWGIGLVIGGALGNVIDRTIYGAVADFFDFRFGNYHWPAFNIADSCICVGVIILVFESFLKDQYKNNKEPKLVYEKN